MSNVVDFGRVILGRRFLLNQVTGELETRLEGCGWLTLGKDSAGDWWVAAICDELRVPYHADGADTEEGALLSLQSKIRRLAELLVKP